MAVRAALLLNSLAVVLVLAQGATNVCAFCFHDVADVVACTSCDEAHHHCHEDGSEHQHQHGHTCKAASDFNIALRAQTLTALNGALCNMPETSRRGLAITLFAEQPVCNASPPNLLLLREFQLPTLLC